MYCKVIIIPIATNILTQVRSLEEFSSLYDKFLDNIKMYIKSFLHYDRYMLIGVKKMSHITDIMKEARHNIKWFSDEVPDKKLIDDILKQAHSLVPHKNNFYYYRIKVLGPEHQEEKGSWQLLLFVEQVNNNLETALKKILTDYLKYMMKIYQTKIEKKVINQ